MKPSNTLAAGAHTGVDADTDAHSLQTLAHHPHPYLGHNTAAQNKHTAVSTPELVYCSPSVRGTDS